MCLLLCKLFSVKVKQDLAISRQRFVVYFSRGNIYRFIREATIHTPKSLLNAKSISLQNIIKIRVAKKTFIFCLFTMDLTKTTTL